MSKKKIQFKALIFKVSLFQPDIFQLLHLGQDLIYDTEGHSGHGCAYSQSSHVTHCCEPFY